MVLSLYPALTAKFKIYITSLWHHILIKGTITCSIPPFLECERWKYQSIEACISSIQYEAGGNLVQLSSKCVNGTKIVPEVALFSLYLYLYIYQNLETDFCFFNLCTATWYVYDLITVNRNCLYICKLLSWQNMRIFDLSIRELSSWQWQSFWIYFQGQRQLLNSGVA